MISSALEDRGEHETRRRILVPDSAHGTNPATAAMAGYTVTHLPTADNGSLDRADDRARTRRDRRGRDGHGAEHVGTLGTGD